MTSMTIEDTPSAMQNPSQTEGIRPPKANQWWTRPNKSVLIVGACTLSFLTSIVFLSFAVVLSQRDAVTHAQDVNRCMVDHKYVLDTTPADMSKIQALGYACFTFSGYQLMLDEQVIRVQNFVFQRHENMILLLMVVTITLSGVVLAGVQLVASYRLAAAGKGEFGKDNELAVNKSSLSLRSSIVGLLILVVSFAFFLVFIKDVYQLKEEQVISRPSGPSNPVMSGNLITKKPDSASKSPDLTGENDSSSLTSNGNKDSNASTKFP